MNAADWIDGRARWFVNVHGGRANAVKRGEAIELLKLLLSDAYGRGAAPVRKLLALYANANDCPVCGAGAELNSDVTRWPSGRGLTVIPKNWYVRHGLSCDVGRALESGGDE